MIFPRINSKHKKENDVTIVIILPPGIVRKSRIVNFNEKTRRNQMVYDFVRTMLCCGFDFIRGIYLLELCFQ